MRRPSFAAACGATQARRLSEQEPWQRRIRASNDGNAGTRRVGAALNLVGRPRQETQQSAMQREQEA